MARASADTLKKVPLFSGLDDKELRQIADTMQERRFSAGSTVTQEGAGGVGFFIVEEGQADVSVAGEQRGTITAGDYFGEIALLTDSPRTATITARTDLLCYGMTPWDFRPLVESNSAIAWKLLTAMAEKMR
jgi:CRP/FNR family cyclic AMP-dependent transcriptional regulator